MRRPLSQMERIIWSMAKYFQSIAMITVRVRGPFIASSFYAALAQLRVRHPLLALRVGAPHRWGAYWLADGVPDFSVRIIAGCTEEQWIAVAEAEMEQGFPFDTGPLTRFVVLQAAEFFDLIIVLNHVVADGLSVVGLALDLVQQLGNPAAAKPPAALLPPMEQLFPPRPKRSPRQRRALTAKPGRGPSCVDTSGRLALLCWSLSEAETATLRTRSRAEQTTVYAAICVAFMRAFADLDKSSQVRRIETPVSLRERLSQPIGETFGTYMSLVETETDSAPDRPFWDVARAFKQELSQQVESEALFARWRQLERFAAWIPNALLSWLLRTALFPFKIGYDLSITNLGRIEIPDSYGALQLESILGVAIKPSAANHRILSTLTLGGRLRFCFATRDRALGQQIWQRASRYLAEAAATVTAAPATAGR